MAAEPAKAKRFLAHLEPLQAALEAYCRRNINDLNEVEDALQSALAKAFGDFDLYVENTNFRAWIFRYLNYEILNRNRKGPLSDSAMAEPAARDAWESVIAEAMLHKLHEAPEIVLEECDELVATAVRDLPPLERSVLLLRAIGDFNYREIAEIVELPIGSVMGYLGRSRATLRRKLMDHCRREGLIRDTDHEL